MHGMKHKFVLDLVFCLVLSSLLSPYPFIYLLFFLSYTRTLVPFRFIVMTFGINEMAKNLTS
jgi:hypothetical protein